MKKAYQPGDLFEAHRRKMAQKHKEHSAAAISGMKRFMAEEAKEKRYKKAKKHKESKKHESRETKAHERGESKAVEAKENKSKKHKNWIQGAIKHPGALHRQLGVAEGKKIPAKTLKAAAKKGGKMGARARLAETLKGLHHKRDGSHEIHKSEHLKMHKHHMEMHEHHKRMAEAQEHDKVMQKHHKKMAEHHKRVAMHHKRMSTCD